MELLGQQIIGMLVLRPYVFIPIVLFSFLAYREMGGLRTVVWSLLAFIVAFAAEYSSVRNGFPFGWYYYVKAPTAEREVWISNVPFMDSASFVFLSYWSLAAARWLTGQNLRGKSFPWITWILGAVLMTLADVVIDPIALRGGRWFLGMVFGYPVYGPYYGITLENFAGWLCVGLSVMGAFIWLDRTVFVRKSLGPWRLEAGSALLYIGIVAFNLGITAYLHEMTLLRNGLLIMIPIFACIVWRVRA